MTLTTLYLAGIKNTDRTVVALVEMVPSEFIYA
jgi:hypothetical protein